MKVQYVGTLKIFIKKSFTSNEGEEVEYFVGYFVNDEEDDVLIINTKQDLGELVDQHGVIDIELQNDGKKKLISFKTPQARTSNRE